MIFFQILKSIYSTLHFDNKEFSNQKEIKPVNSINKGIADLTLDKDICTACRKCEDVCPILCIEIQIKEKVVMNGELFQYDIEGPFGQLREVPSEFKNYNKSKKILSGLDIERVDKNRFAEFKIDKVSCTLCGLCINKCPTGALRFSPNGHRIVKKIEEINETYRFYPVQI
ncbi:MAG: 4Fe-4S binding protein [Pseudomonadota bacterium]